METKGPRIGEVWDLGMIHGVVFLGEGFDFAEEKHYIFQDGDHFFVLRKMSSGIQL